MLDMVRQCDRCVIRYGHSADPAWLIAQIALAFPDASIVIAVARIDDARRLFERLHRWLPDSELSLMTGKSKAVVETNRVLVATYISLGDGAARTAHRNIFIAGHAIEVLSKKGKRALDEASNARFVGLLPLDEELAPRDEDEMRGYFGFVEVEVPGHGQCPLAVDLALEPMAGGPRIPHEIDDLQLMRKGIWQNPVRNRCIAKLAKDLPGGSQLALGKRFPTVAKAVEGIESPRTAVIGANIEQALALANQLPGWAIARARDGETRGLRRRDRDLLDQARPGLGRTNKLIVTVAAIELLALAQIDVLIRADGGVGATPFAAAQLAIDGRSDHRLLLVDFADRHNPELRRRSRQRRDAYTARGWFAPGADPVSERVKLFLARRPREVS